MNSILFDDKIDTIQKPGSLLAVPVNIEATYREVRMQLHDSINVHQA